MKTKRMVSLLLAVLLILSFSVTVFAETPTFSGLFDTVEQMNSYIKKYSDDFPKVDYVYGGIVAPSKGYTLKHKEFLQVTINDPEYEFVSVCCGESGYEKGIDYTYSKYKSADGDTRVTIDVEYGVSEVIVRDALKKLEDNTYGYQEIFIGEVSGYPYVAGDYYEGGEEECMYKIAIGDVIITCYTNMLFDKKLLDSLVISKTGITLPVYEALPEVPDEVSDELLDAVRVEYNKDDLEIDDINITDFEMISDAKQFVRYTVSNYMYTCDAVEQNIGDFVFCVPQRPLPQVLFEGVLYELKDAYESGIVSDDDLYTISAFESRSYKLVHKNDLLGDITGDMKVDIYDATTIQRCLAGLIKLSWQREEYADFDNDGMVTILDATGIQKKVAKLA